MSSIENLTVENFNDLLKNNTNYLIIKLGADWCSPCKTIEPLVNLCFNDLSEKYKIQCIQVDVDESLDLFAFFKKKRVIKGIPAILLYKKGNIGPMPDDSVLDGNENNVSDFFTRALTLIKNTINN